MKEINDCCHNFQSSFNIYIYYCKYCTIYKINNTTLSKPKTFKPIEHDLFREIEKIKNEKLIITNFNYLKKRICLIEYLRKLVDVCKYEENVYYLTLHLVDTILAQNYYTNKYDLVVIGCLLLAGISILI